MFVLASATLYMFENVLFKGEVSQPLITRVFLGRVPESMTADDLRSFFNEEAAKYDPEATVILC